MDLKSGIQIGLAIALLLSFFATYLSSKTWQVTHVVLVFLIFVASGAYWYLAATTLKIHNFHRTQINELREQIDLTERQIDAMQNGIDLETADEQDDAVLASLEREDIRVANSSIRETETQIYKFTLDRGRVWPEAELDSVAADGTATVTVSKPIPHGIEPEMVVFGFETGEPSEGAKFMSGFKVTGVNENTLTLAPLSKLLPRRLEQLTASRGNWDLYEVLPVDRHDVFAGLDEQELADLIPEGSRQEYLKDGQIADANDPPERVQGYKDRGVLAKPDEEERIVERRYVRQLRDYEFEFNYLAGQITMLYVDMERIRTDTARLQLGLEKTEAMVAVRTAEKDKLTQDLGRFKQELQIATDYLAALGRSHAGLLGQLKITYDNTRRLAAELAQVQFDAAEQIDRRTELAPTASR